MSAQKEHHPTAVSSASRTKILNNLTYTNKNASHRKREIQQLSRYNTQLRATESESEAIAKAQHNSESQNNNPLCNLDEDNILYRGENSNDDRDNYPRALVRENYEKRLRTGLYQMREAIQDSMLSLREAMLAILGDRNKDIKDIAGFENAYLGENALSGMNQAEIEAFERLVCNPMLEEVARLSKTDEEQ